MAQDDQDKSEVADVNVETNEDGSKSATVVTTDGKTGSGSSSGGVVSEPSTEEATKEAADDAKSK